MAALADRIAAVARPSRTRRTGGRPWEFWPTWAAYAPVVPWIATLAMRHRGVRPITAANPGMPDGGLVGESKFGILARLPRAWTVPSALLDAGDPETRARAAAAFADLPGVGFPLVLKPDVGQRGVGVQKVATHADALTYLRHAGYAAVAQPWHPGPFEAGIFYWRHPEATCGRIFSITDKVFPVVTGDGVRPLQALIQAHPRFSRQAAVFLRRHARQAGRVLEAGERFALGAVGNHSQGTLFRDGAQLWTSALESRVDEIARQVPGFYIGRFDVRYGTREGFMAGDDLAIIELNGVTAEPTDIYDPDRSIVSSYRGLYEQWRLVFEIGSANMRRGHAGASLWRLAQLGLAHLLDRRHFPVSS